MLVLLAACWSGGNAPTVPSNPRTSLAAPPGTMSPLTLDRRARIAFSCRVDAKASGDICVSDLDGSHFKRLTFGPANQFDPSWSPDGKRIAFRSAPSPDVAMIGPSDIWVVDADGTDLRNLTRHPDWGNWSPAWSPNGQLIAYYSAPGGRPGLFLMAPDGSHRRRILEGDAEYPAWSPDGSQLAFMSLGFPAGTSSSAYDVYMVRVDGTGLRRLTYLPGEDGWPAWSPDGRTIAFDHDPSGTGGGPYDIYLTGAAGGPSRRITPGAGGLSYDYPDWSSDGSLILFSGYDQTTSAGGIFVMRSDGTGVTQLNDGTGLTPVMDDGVSPTWRPEFLA